MTYKEKLKLPQWQKKRLEIMQRDNWTCRICRTTDDTLNVHHGYYDRMLEPWQYPDKSLYTICENCHNNTTQEMKDVYKIIGFIPPELIRHLIEDLKNKLTWINEFNG